MVKVAGRFGRYGYRMVTGMLRAEGWVVNHKRVERIWREEGLKVPKKQPKRGRLWLTDGSCIRLRPLYRHHVWAYDFVADRTHDGRPLKMLTVLDEYSRECLAIVVARRLRADDVLQTLSELFVEHGPPANLRSDNGPEFTAKVVREWLERVEVKTLYIEPGSPWENGYNESFNGTLGEEVLKREIFYSLEEAAVLVEQWRREYNTIRPHSSLRYRDSHRHRESWVVGISIPVHGEARFRLCQHRELGRFPKGSSTVPKSDRAPAAAPPSRAKPAFHREVARAVIRALNAELPPTERLRQQAATGTTRTVRRRLEAL